MKNFENAISSIVTGVTACFIGFLVFLTKKKKLEVIRDVAIKKAESGDNFELNI